MAFNFTVKVEITTSEGNTYELGEFGNAPGLASVGLICDFDDYDGTNTYAWEGSLWEKNGWGASQVKQLYCPTDGLVASLNVLEDEYNLAPTIVDSDKFVSAIGSLGLAPEDAIKVIIKCDDGNPGTPDEPVVPIEPTL